MAKDEETWRRMVLMASPFDIELDGEDMDALWEAYMKAPNVKETVNHWFLMKCIEYIAQKHLKESTLDQETVAIYERIKSSGLVSPVIKGLIEKLEEGLGKLNEFREKFVTDQERLLKPFIDVADIPDIYGDILILTTVMRNKYEGLKDCNYVVAEMFTLWREYEKKVAFFENLLERFETFNGLAWPEMARPAYRKVLSEHLDINVADIPDAQDVVKALLMRVNMHRERALLREAIELLKSRLDNIRGVVTFLGENPENNHLMDMINGINDVYDELTKRFKDLDSQLVGDSGVVFIVPHVGSGMRNSSFLTEDEYHKFLKYSL